MQEPCTKGWELINIKTCNELSWRVCPAVFHVFKVLSLRWAVPPPEVSLGSQALRVHNVRQKVRQERPPIQTHQGAPGSSCRQTGQGERLSPGWNWSVIPGVWEGKMWYLNGLTSCNPPPSFFSPFPPPLFYRLSRCLCFLVLQSANLKLRDVIVKLKAYFWLFGGLK